MVEFVKLPVKAVEATRKTKQKSLPRSKASGTSWLDELKTHVNELVGYAKKDGPLGERLAIGGPAVIGDALVRNVEKFTPGGSIHQLMHGGTGDPAEDTSAALDAAAFMQSGALPFAPASKGGTVGTLTGPFKPGQPKGDHYIPAKKIEKAMKAMDKGADTDDLWHEFQLSPWLKRDKSGVWAPTMLGEISDLGASIKPNHPPTGVLPELIDHPELFDKYPSIAKLPYIKTKMPKNTTGRYYLDGALGLNASNSKKQNLLTTLHEIGGHHIQNMKGLPLEGYIDGTKISGGVGDIKRALMAVQLHRMTPLSAENYAVDKIHKELAGKIPFWANRRFKLLQRDPFYSAYESMAYETQARDMEHRFLLGSMYGQEFLDKMSPSETMTDTGFPLGSLIWPKR